MNKWFTVLCYKDVEDGGPAFKRTEVFEAADYEAACEIGERKLDSAFPEDVKLGYNNWTISLDKLIKEAKHLP